MNQHTGPTGDESSGAGQGFDPNELRDRLHHVVDGIQPRPDALDRLRRGVPMRRRKRAAVSVTATAFALVGVGVASASAIGLVDRPAAGAGRLASGSQHGGGIQQSTSTALQINGSPGTNQQPGGTGAPGPTQTVVAGNPPPASPPRSAGTASAAPECTPSAIGKLSVVIDSTSGGVTYGHVDGVDLVGCQISGQPQVVAAVLLPSPQQSGMSVPQVRSGGTRYTGLANVPDSATSVLLTPGQHVQAQFAWVPQACQTPTQTSAPEAGTVPTSSASTATGGPQTPTASPTTPPAPTTYAVSFTFAATGARGDQSTASTNLSGQCGVTLYTTDDYRAGQYPLPTAPPDGGSGN
jgi:hypothetical protein